MISTELKYGIILNVILLTWNPQSPRSIIGSSHSFERINWHETNPSLFFVHERNSSYFSRSSRIVVSAQSHVEEIYSKLDSDGNGSIDLDEFKKYVKEIILKLLEEM